MWDSPDKSGDIGLITKKKPTSGGAALTELLSESDNYSIEFNKEAHLSATQKATVLGAQILADYMYFDGNTDKCRFADEGIYCYLCYCSIVGCIAPCYLFIPTK